MTQLLHTEMAAQVLYMELDHVMKTSTEVTATHRVGTNAD